MRDVPIVDVLILWSGFAILVLFSFGEKFDGARHTQGTEIKAITYSNMQIHESSDRSDLYVIVDIWDNIYNCLMKTVIISYFLQLIIILFYIITRVMLPRIRESI